MQKNHSGAKQNARSLANHDLRLQVFLAVLTTLVVPSLVSAQAYGTPDTWGGDILTRPRLTGDWGGLRGRRRKGPGRARQRRYRRHCRRPRADPVLNCELYLLKKGGDADLLRLMMFACSPIFYAPAAAVNKLLRRPA